MNPFQEIMSTIVTSLWSSSVKARGIGVALSSRFQSRVPTRVDHSMESNVRSLPFDVVEL